jgi:hypothetical protein
MKILVVDRECAQNGAECVEKLFLVRLKSWYKVKEWIPLYQVTYIIFSSIKWKYQVKGIVLGSSAWRNWFDFAPSPPKCQKTSAWHAVWPFCPKIKTLPPCKKET